LTPLPVGVADDDDDIRATKISPNWFLTTRQTKMATRSKNSQGFALKSLPRVQTHAKMPETST